ARDRRHVPARAVLRARAPPAPAGQGARPGGRRDHLKGPVMATNHLHEIEALGQSIWLDNISRKLLEDGTLKRLIDEDGLSGGTSNPTIFEKALGPPDLYDDGLREAVDAGLEPRDIFFRLAIRDIREGADLLRPIWERTGGQDGYISFELPPELADDAQGSIEAAK